MLREPMVICGVHGILKELGTTMRKHWVQQVDGMVISVEPTVMTPRTVRDWLISSITITQMKTLISSRRRTYSTM